MKVHHCCKRKIKKTEKRRLRILRSKFSNWDPLDSSFDVSLNSKGEVVVMLTDSRKSAPHVLIDADGNINEKELKISKKIQKSLGQPAEEIVETNEVEIARRQEKVRELREQRATNSDKNLIENINQTITEELDAIAQLGRANENIEQRMTLRDRVKAIFKKYGFTVLAVASAVGVVIGVIFANLKNGLTTFGKRVGNGLKTIGKKLGEILPGLVGAIASFVFRTAGEVVGFLAKNTWLLVVGVVIDLVEQFKKK